MERRRRAGRVLGRCADGAVAAEVYLIFIGAEGPDVQNCARSVDNRVTRPHYLLCCRHVHINEGSAQRERARAVDRVAKVEWNRERVEWE